MDDAVAVIIPCYNTGRFVRSALESVQAQTRRAAEIVIIDDGSTDLFTRHELAELRAHGTTVITTPNGGVSAARNCGIRLTSSPYIITLDADDRLTPDYVEATAAVLDQDPGSGFVTTAIQAFGDASYLWIPEPGSAASALIRGPAHPASIFRRRLWEAVGGFDETLLGGCEDLDFWVSALAAGFSGHVVPEPLLQYRVRRDSVHHTLVARGGQLRAMETVLLKHRAVLSEAGPEVLLAKDVLIQEQRQHLAGLARRDAALREERQALEHRIAETTGALRSVGCPPLEWGDLAGMPTGFDATRRGTSVAECYLDLFLAQHAADIAGRVACIGSSSRLRTLAAANGPRTDTTMLEDPSSLASLAEQSLDCIVAMSGLGAPRRARGTLAETRRVLRTGGILLWMLPLAPGLMTASSRESTSWGWTEASARRLFSEVFPLDGFSVRPIGYAASYVASLHGLAVEELPDFDPACTDQWHPLLVAVRATRS
ncbi:MAG: glycosyltransferase [Acidobacteriota bacterium]